MIYDQTLGSTALEFPAVDLTGYSEFDFRVIVYPNGSAAADSELVANFSLDGGSTYPASSSFTRVVTVFNATGTASGGGVADYAFVIGQMDKDTAFVMGEAVGRICKGTAGTSARISVVNSTSYDGTNNNIHSAFNRFLTNGVATNVKFRAGVANFLGAGSRLIVTGRV